MIRQTFSCDICGADKRESNHWFVAMEHDGEIRIGTWAALGRRRRGALHLCGQKCLYKLVDDFFIRRATSARTPVEVETCVPIVDDPLVTVPAPMVDPRFDEWESSARLIPTPDKPTRVNRDVAPALDERAARSAKQATVEAGESTVRETAGRNPARNSVQKPLRDGVAAATARAIQTRQAAPDMAPRPSSQEGGAAMQHSASAAMVTQAAVVTARRFAGEPVGAIASEARTPEPIRAATPVRAVETLCAAVPRVEVKSVPSPRPSSDGRRSASAWQRERAREQGTVVAATRSGTVAPSSRLVPNRIESRLHPILRPRALEA